MYKFVITCLFLLGLSARALAGQAVNSHLSSGDVSRLQKVFADGLSSSDLQSIYYSTLNLQVTEAAEKQDLCKKLLQLHAESKINAFEKDYYLVGSHKQLKCAEKLPEAVLTVIYASLKQNLATVAEIYYRVATHKLLGVQIDETTTAKIVKTLQELLRKDDTLASLGYAFSVAPELGASASFVALRVEDAFVQADEVDGKLLQFEGGLSITALLVNSGFRVTQYYKKELPVTGEQLAKFSNYFLSRRSVQTPKGAHLLIEALKTISGAGKLAPICIQLIGNGQLQAESPVLSIAVVDLLGKALKPVPQNIVGKISLKQDNSVFAAKVPFVSKSSDKTSFAADLASFKPSRGLYYVDVSVSDSYQQRLHFKVQGRVKVQSLEVGIAESDAAGGSAYKKHNVAYPSTLSTLLSADNTQKLLLKTMLVDEATGKAIAVHQAFVQLYNKNTNQEIVFIAEQDSNKAYKFDMDIGAHAADFAHKSGEYEIHLIIGDASLSNSFQWHVANVQLKFSGEEKESKKQVVRAAIPEIVHQFRVPEKRPARIVSDVFTGLCLTPLVLLFIFWSKLGINVSNFTLAPSTIGFHVGLGGILTLFGVFWWKLNMFETLRLLIPIAFFTFLCGNRLLRRLHAQRVAKSPS